MSLHILLDFVRFRSQQVTTKVLIELSRRVITMIIETQIMGVIGALNIAFEDNATRINVLSWY